MQIGIRLHDTIEGTLEEKLDYITNQGFVCAHVALKKVFRNFPNNESALNPGYAMYLRHEFERRNMDIAVLGCYKNLANPNTIHLQQIIETYRANIRFAAHLNCGVVGTETGAPNEKNVYEEACRGEEAFQYFLKNLRIIVEYAEKMGVLLAIEPVTKHIVYDAKRARRVLDEIQSPNLRIILDPVNLLDERNYEQRDEIFEEAIEQIGSEVAVVHIKDFIMENGRMKAVAAGTGEMDYTRILRFLKEQKPYMHVTLENTCPNNAKDSLQFLKKQYQSL